MDTGFDRSKSLQELENSDWGEASYPSYLVTTVHALRRKPLDQFTTEDIRIMIGQRIGLPYLMPLAIEVLQQNPLASGEFYPGDLMGYVLSIGMTFWQEHPEVWSGFEDLISQLEGFVEAWRSAYPKGVNSPDTDTEKRD